MSGMSRSARPVAVTGLLVAALMGGLVLFQVLLAAGAPWGRAAYGGQSAELPAYLRVASAVAAVVWSFVALLVLRRVGVIGWSPMPTRWLRAASWVVVVVMALATVLNAITPSAIERAIWFPVSALMLVGMLVVVLRG